MGNSKVYAIHVDSPFVVRGDQRGFIYKAVVGKIGENQFSEEAASTPGVEPHFLFYYWSHRCTKFINFYMATDGATGWLFSRPFSGEIWTANGQIALVDMLDETEQQMLKTLITSLY